MERKWGMAVAVIIGREFDVVANRSHYFLQSRITDR